MIATADGARRGRAVRPEGGGGGGTGLGRHSRHPGEQRGGWCLEAGASRCAGRYREGRVCADDAAQWRRSRPRRRMPASDCRCWSSRGRRRPLRRPAGPDAVDLAKRIAASKHLIFGGLHAYHGSAQHRRHRGGAAHADRQRGRCVAAHSGAARQQGLDCPIVSGAGTGTFQSKSASGVYNEIQAGSYVFMDADYGRNLDEPAPVGMFRHSLFVLATVMSVPTEHRGGGCGHKAVAVDSGMPTLWQRPDSATSALRTSTASWRSGRRPRAEAG